MTTPFDSYARKILLGIAAAPALALALSSGPGMPEYNDFESVDNTDLVNLATGDMSYSIPVMTVPGPGLGFPIVLNYHAGIQPEQEASWVGLGWNLQAGAVTRQVNNFPDDFNRIPIEERIKSSHIHGWMASVGFNGVTVGLSWDSEQGVGGMVGFAMQIPSTPISVGVQAGVNGVYEGVGITLSMSLPLGEGPGAASANMSIGMHSKSGSTAGVTVSKSDKSGTATGSISMSSNGGLAAGASMSKSLASASVTLSSRSGLSAGASIGVAVSTATTVSANVRTSSSNYFIPVFTPWGYGQVNWGTWDVYIDGLQEDFYYGFLYSDSLAMGCKVGAKAGMPGSCYLSDTTYTTTCPDNATCPANQASLKRAKKMDFSSAGAYSYVHDASAPDWMKIGQTGEDLYSVQTQGMSGTFRPHRTEDGDYYTYISNQHYGYQTTCQGWTGSWFGKKCSREGSINFGLVLEGDTSLSVDGGTVNYADRNHHGTAYSRVSGLVWRFNEESGGALYTDPSTRDAGPTVNAASKKIQPYFDANGRISGWILTSADGVRYLYLNAQYNYAQQNLSASEASLSTWTRRETPYYAYAWLLSAILSPDHVYQGAGCSDENCLPDADDIGGWVLFHYTNPQVVAWRSPVGALSVASSYSLSANNGTVPTPDTYTATSGIKSISYLSKIETPTHVAEFNVDDMGRSDGLPPEIDSIGYNVTFTQSTVTDSLYCSSEGPPHPHARPVYTTTIRVPTAVFGSGTTVSVVARRKAGWTKWVFLDRKCRTGWRDQLIGVYKLDTLTQSGGYYQIPVIGGSPEIQLVRVVIGNVGDVAGSASALSFLRGITLKNKVFDREVSAVQFGYDYSLAQGSPNSISAIQDGDGGDGGRLTLRTVRQGAGSKGPWSPAYQFFYTGSSIRYHSDKKDYWGNYCASCAGPSRRPDGTANIWNLNRIVAPSGSEIRISYEDKRINYFEGIPTVVDGDDIGDYIAINGENLVVGSSPGVNHDYGLPFNIEKAFDEQSMRQEIRSRMANTKVMYLGRFDLNHSKGGSQDVFLKHLAVAGANKYIIEAPRVYVEDQVGTPLINTTPSYSYRKGITYGLYFDNPDNVPSYVIGTSGEVSCPGSWSCRFDVGIETDSLKTLTIPKFYHHHMRHKVIGGSGYLVADNGWENQTWMRVWAVFNDANPLTSDLAALAPYGGGVRVSQVSYYEPYSQQENVVEYSYEDASTPTLPDPMSNYFLGIRYAQASGDRYYMGNPSVLHGKVTTRYHVNGNSKYSTEYHFVTSRDLPIRIEKTRATGGLHAKAKVIDRSGLWGSLWKKVDRDTSGNVVREELTRWANRINSSWRTQLNIGGGENIDLAKDGHTILKAFDDNLRVFAASGTDSSYFGISQRLFSNRYLPDSCDAKDEGAAKSACVQRAGALSGQIEIVRFSPLSRTRVTIQDRLKDSTESNWFDYLTGTPLVEIQHSRDAGNVAEYVATLKSLAHHHTGYGVYNSMKTRNMLSQEFSTTTFRFTENPAGKNFKALSSADLRQVVSSQYTTWLDYYAGSGVGVQFRKSGTAALVDTAGGFTLPTPAGAGGVWRWQGTNTVYNDYGHLEEFQDALGQHNAQIHGYGQSLPAAFIQNATRNQVFYRSFETAEEGADPGYTHRLSKARSKTGDGSLRVINCREKVGGVLVSKPECSDTLNTMTCFALPPLSLGTTYEASAWFYDEYRGSNTSNPSDPTYLNKTTEVTRPGLYIGRDTLSCNAATFPNGANHDFEGTSTVAPASHSSWNADQRALGNKKWRRLSVDFTPDNSCDLALQNSYVCLYASKAKRGTDVYYDEVRVRPKQSLMTTYAYDHRGNMISSAGPNEVVKHFEYDAFGNLSGTRDDDGVLTGMQGKQHGLRKSTVSLSTVPPVNDTICQPPFFKDEAGGQIFPYYSLQLSRDTTVAWLGTGEDTNKVCTLDKGGSTIIEVVADDGVHNIPITVTSSIPGLDGPGTQLGMMDVTCGSWNPDAEGMNCLMDIASLKDRIEAREGTAVSSSFGNTWLMSFDMKNLKSGGGYYPNTIDGNLTAPSSQLWLGYQFVIPDDNGYSFPAQGMHLLFGEGSYNESTMRLRNPPSSLNTPQPAKLNLPEGIKAMRVYYGPTSTSDNFSFFYTPVISVDLSHSATGTSISKLTDNSRSHALRTATETGRLSMKKDVVLSLSQVDSIVAKSPRPGLDFRFRYYGSYGSDIAFRSYCLMPSIPVGNGYSGCANDGLGVNARSVKVRVSVFK